MPTSGRELELKFRLEGAHALDALAQAAGGRAEPAVEQVNHFFDSEAFDLRHRKYVLRLREEGTRRLLTAKGPQERSADGAFSATPETEVVVSRPQAEALLAGTVSPIELLEQASLSSSERPLIEAIRAAVGEKPLRRVGTFSNQRTRIHARLPGRSGEITAMLELDCTRFPKGVVDYEVEMEVPSGVDPAEAEAALRGLLERAGVNGHPSTSKARRFFSILASRSDQG